MDVEVIPGCHSFYRVCLFEQKPPLNLSFSGMAVKSDLIIYGSFKNDHPRAGFNDLMSIGTPKTDIKVYPLNGGKNFNKNKEKWFYIGFETNTGYDFRMKAWFVRDHSCRRKSIEKKNGKIMNESGILPIT